MNRADRRLLLACVVSIAVGGFYWIALTAVAFQWWTR